MHFVCRNIVCQHRIEVEVSPATAEVCFQDERFSNPVDAQVRFSASVYNAPTSRVTWQVSALDGGPAAGTIDQAGLYIAPAKGSLPFGLTEIVTVTSIDDPFRQAQARVTVVGLGPLPKPKPRVEIYPRRVDLYYPQGHDNACIDSSNTMQLFRARVFHAEGQPLEWLVNGGAPTEAPDFMYSLSAPGWPATTRITVRLKNDPGVSDWATVSQLNYDWPGIIS